MDNQIIKSCFQEAEVPVSFYKRGPFGKDSLSINITKGEVKIWAGNSDLDIIPDPVHKQLVINVKEGNREIKATYSKYIREIDYDNLDGDTDDEKCVSYINSLTTDSILSRINVNLNTRVRPKVISSTLKNDNYGIGLIIKLLYKIRGSKFTFLVGYDEPTSQSPFVSRLKGREVIKSVKEAHKKLRPKDISKRALRQGEWFFDPVSKDLNKELYENMTHRKHLNHFYGSGVWRWNLGSHRAGKVINHNKNMYAIGKIEDVRKGRHEPITLTKWHRVVRNNELVGTNNSGSWD